MAFDGNGNWVSNYSAVAQRDADLPILASNFDNILLADLATSFENCLTKDMRVKPQQAFDANSYKVINVANPTNSMDAVNKQTMDGAVSTMLSTLYPVGSVYVGTQASCPLETLISGSTWDLVASNVVTNINSTVPVKGTGMTMGLTDGTNNLGMQAGSGQSVYLSGRTASYGSNVGGIYGTATPSNKSIGLTKDGSKSGVVADMSSVTNLTLNVWKRTA